MITDDQTSPDPLPRRTLAELIVESPRGLDSDRVIKWAAQLAAGLEPGTAVDPKRVIIDDHDDARLSPPPMTERDLLLAGPPADSVHGLAATMYEALAGRPPDTPAAPIPGVTVQANLALLAGLSGIAGTRPPDAAALVEMLQGEPVGPASPPRGDEARAARPLLSTVAGALALVAVLFGVWLWLGGDRPLPVPPLVTGIEQTPLGRDDATPPSDGVGSELAEVTRDMNAAAARRAQQQWTEVMRQEPEILFVRLESDAQRVKAQVRQAAELLDRGQHNDARRLFEESIRSFGDLLEEHRDAHEASGAMEASWQSAVAAAPVTWLDDDSVQSICADAEALAVEARKAAAAGEYLTALEAYDDAIEQLREAVASHTRKTEALLAQSRRDREDGRFQDALELIQRVASLRDPQEIKAAQVETYLALARARNARSTREEARQAVEAILALDPGHAEAQALRGDMASHWADSRGDIMVNSLSQTLVFVGPGGFVMGSPRMELFHQRSERQHHVELTKGFWMGRIEVTRGQFGVFVSRTGYVTDAEAAGWALGLGSDGRWQRSETLTWRHPGFAQTDNHPVVCVSYADAQAFCRWLSAHEGRVYRLPTEAEWEYACRAGSDSAYAWGGDPYDDLPHANTADAAWMARFPESVGFQWFDGFIHTSPVANFPANAWGLFDMHGNVQEWCLDVYAPYDTEQTTDPTGPMFGDERAPRVLRGGSFAAPPAHCRAAHRDASRPDSRFVTAGFRVVMEE